MSEWEQRRIMSRDWLQMFKSIDDVSCNRCKTEKKRNKISENKRCHAVKKTTQKRQFGKRFDSFWGLGLTPVGICWKQKHVISPLGCPASCRLYTEDTSHLKTPEMLLWLGNLQPKFHLKTVIGAKDHSKPTVNSESLVSRLSERLQAHNRRGSGRTGTRAKKPLLVKWRCSIFLLNKITIVPPIPFQESSIMFGLLWKSTGSQITLLEASIPSHWKFLGGRQPWEETLPGIDWPSGAAKNHFIDE